MNEQDIKSFSGFSPATLEFLRNVRENNSKPWFQQPNSEYQRMLLDPLRQLVGDLEEAMLTIDPYFETRPSINRTISRIYRDTRFSRDKSLFKDKMWIVFKRPSKNWQEESIGYFFEISVDSYRYGMDNFREAISQNSKSFKRAIAFYRESDSPFSLEGEQYKKPIKNDCPEDLQEWFQLKSFYFCRNKSIDEILFSAKLVDELIEAFFTLGPLYQFLIRI